MRLTLASQTLVLTGTVQCFDNRSMGIPHHICIREGKGTKS